jgi:hypothetical protein
MGLELTIILSVSTGRRSGIPYSLSLEQAKCLPFYTMGCWKRSLKQPHRHPTDNACGLRTSLVSVACGCATMIYVERPRRKTQTVDLENFCPEGLMCGVGIYSIHDCIQLYWYYCTAVILGYGNAHNRQTMHAGRGGRGDVFFCSTSSLPLPFQSVQYGSIRSLPRHQ